VLVLLAPICLTAATSPLVENAKKRIIDVVGCAIGGAHAPGNQALVNLVRKWGGKQEATLFVHGCKVPADNAAIVNAIMCRFFDFKAMSMVVEGNRRKSTVIRAL